MPGGEQYSCISTSLSMCSNAQSQMTESGQGGTAQLQPHRSLSVLRCTGKQKGSGRNINQVKCRVHRVKARGEPHKSLNVRVRTRGENAAATPQVSQCAPMFTGSGPGGSNTAAAPQDSQCVPVHHEITDDGVRAMGTTRLPGSLGVLRCTGRQKGT